MFIYWDCKILSGTATFHKRGVLDCNFQNPSEIPVIVLDPCSSAALAFSIASYRMSCVRTCFCIYIYKDVNELRGNGAAD